MVDGLWNKDTFLNAQDATKDAMTFDMLSALNDHMVELCKQPALCNTVMDEKIKDERKRKGKISLGLGSGGGVGAFAILESIKSWFNSG